MLLQNYHEQVHKCYSKDETQLFCSDIYKLLLTNLAEVKESLTEIRKTQTYLVAKVDAIMRATGFGGSLEELPENVRFPLPSIEALMILEKELEDRELKNCVVSDILLYSHSCYG